MSLATRQPKATTDPASSHAVASTTAMANSEATTVRQRCPLNARLTWGLNLGMTAVYAGLFVLDRTGYHAGRNALLIAAVAFNLSLLALAAAIRFRRR